MMHSVRTFSIMRVGVVGVKAYRYQRDSKLWKSFIHRKRFRKWLVGGCIPPILPPGSVPGHKLQKPPKEWHISVTWQH